MDKNLEQFDDPALKAALKHALGGQKAPDRLRSRLAGIFSADNAPLPPLHSTGEITKRTHLPFWRRPAVVWGIAAMMLVALLGQFYALGDQGTVDQHVGRNTVRDMLRTHDHCSANAANHSAPNIPQNDFDGMGRAMSSALGQTVLVADMRKDGWLFSGGSICKVGQVDTAHLIFVRDGRSLSVFSMPSSCCKSNMNDCGICSQSFDDHVVAARVTGNRLLALVSKCPRRSISKDELAALLKKHEGELIAPPNDVLLIGR
jgi:hypothetical protein